MQAADRHRRRPLRAARRLSAGAVEPGRRSSPRPSIGGFASQPRSLRRNPRRREVEHGRPARQRDLRRHAATARRRRRRRPAATTTCCRRAAAASATSTATANYSEQYTLERRQRRSQVPARRADRRRRWSARCVVNGAILTSIDPNFSRPYTDEYTLRRRSRADGQLQAERGRHLSPRKEHAGVDEPRQPVCDHADAAPSIPASTASSARPTTAPTASTSACRPRTGR